MYRLSAICHSALAGGRPRIPAASQALLGHPKWRPGFAWNRGGSSDPRAAGPRGGRERLPPRPYTCVAINVCMDINVCMAINVCMDIMCVCSRVAAAPRITPSLQKPRVGVAPRASVGSARSLGMCPPLRLRGFLRPAEARTDTDTDTGGLGLPGFARAARVPRRQERRPLPGLRWPGEKR